MAYVMVSSFLRSKSLVHNALCELQSKVCKTVCSVLRIDSTDFLRNFNIVLFRTLTVNLYVLIMLLNILDIIFLRKAKSTNCTFMIIS